MREEFVLDMNLDISKAEAKAKKLNAEFEKQKLKVEEVKRRYQESFDKLEEISALVDRIEASTEKTAEGEKLRQAELKSYLADMQVLIDKTQKEKAEYELQKAKLYEKGVAIKENIQGHREEAAEIENVSEQTKKVSNGFTKFANRLKELVKQAFIFTVISQALRKLKQQFSDFIKQDPVLNSMMTELKTNLRIIGQIFVETIKPVLQWILEKLVFITDTIVSALAKLIGKSVKEMKALAKATKEATKAFAGFDTIQIIDTSGDGSGGESMVNTVKNTLENIYAMLAIGAGLIVLGAILAFSGVNIPIGITLMALGAVMIYSAISEHWDELPEKMKGVIRAFLVVGGLIGVFIGLILAFTGHLFIGLAMIALGGAAVWAALKKDLTTEEAQQNFESTLKDLFKVVSYVMLTIGIILLLTGHWALGIGAIIGGLSILNITSKDPDGEKLATYINDQLNPVFAIGGSVLIIAGIILCLAGDFLHGAGCLAAGAIMLGYALATGSAESFTGKIIAPFKMAIEWIKRAFTNLSIWASKNIPFFDILISWIVGEEGVKKLKNMEYKALDISNIAYDLGIDSMSAFGFEVDMSPLIKNIHKQRTGEELIAYSIEDGEFTNILTRKQFDEITKKMAAGLIPKYATGAVIPGGSPFLAMLGDQRRGQTNVEAPLDTIVEAFRAVQPEQKFTIEATGSMSQLIKLLNLEIKKEDRRSSIKAVNV